MEWTPRTTIYMNNLGKNLDWLMTWSAQFPTWLKNSHPQDTHIIDTQICDGFQDFSWDMDLLLLTFHYMCKIQLILAQSRPPNPEGML
jgi:hypothetical protein